MKEFEGNQEIPRKKTESPKENLPKQDTSKPHTIFEKKIEPKRTEVILIERFLSEEVPPVLSDRRTFREAVIVLRTVDPEELITFADVLLRNVKKEDDEFWTPARKEGARKMLGILPTEIKEKARSQLRRWHDRADELAFVESKTNVEIAEILKDEGYETNQGNPVSSRRINDYFSQQRSEGVAIPKREISWHARAKEISRLPPSERARVLAEEGYTTRDGNPISESAIGVYLSESRAKGELLPRSESTWHQRANELLSEGKTTPEIAKILAEEGYQTNRKKAISPNALYIYFSRKKTEEESS